MQWNLGEYLIRMYSDYIRLSSYSVSHITAYHVFLHFIAHRIIYFVLQYMKIIPKVLWNVIQHGPNITQRPILKILSLLLTNCWRNGDVPVEHAVVIPVYCFHTLKPSNS